MSQAENTASIVKEASLLPRCLAVDVLLLQAFASGGMCLPSRCLAMGIHVTLCSTYQLQYRYNFEV
jgi:hypothetical protein